LLTEVENNRTGTLVILAGYEDKMKVLMRADPGLPRRFPHNIHLDNYTSSQLSSIALHVSQSRFSRNFASGLKEKLSKHITQQYIKDMSEQNGGLSVNLVESAVTNQEDRIMAELEHLREIDVHGNEMELTATQLLKEKQILKQRLVLTTADFDINDTPNLGESDQAKAEVEAELASLIGMKNVKAFFHRMRDAAKFVSLTGK
jgi:hypothetical protein